MIELNDRVSFLKKSHLFHNLTDDQIEQVAAALTEAAHPAGGVIFEEGKVAEGFYLIYSGGVGVTRTRKGNVEQLAEFMSGDYFGELEVARRVPRLATVSAREDTILLTLSDANFIKLIKEYPRFKNNLAIAISSRRLARKLRFKWLQEGEVIYFLARRHPVLLWQSFFLPVLLLFLPVFLFWLGRVVSSKLVIGVGIAVLVFDLLWTVWKWIDWGNDYSIVTNKRAIWLEKVIGLYESRQETPLINIVIVGVETSAVGRSMDYGNVNVRTYVGRIVFPNIQHPTEAEALINELRERTRSASHQLELEAMKQKLRNRMGLPSKDVSRPIETQTVKVQTFYKPNLLQMLTSKFFSLRSENKDTITYHKHWVVWLQQTYKAWLAILVLVGMMVFGSFFLKSPSNSSLNILTIELDTILSLIMIAAILWLIYEWVDWSNDIFQVTSENIIDIDKRPLGREERKVAPLANILSTGYERVGLMGVLFNYGKVSITVGGAHMAFEDVFDPAGVQQDIDNRRSAYLLQRKMEADKAEQERMADWFITYHNNSDEFRAGGEQKPGGSVQ